MNISRRVAISFVLAAIILLAGIHFWPFIINEIIKPTALVVWLFLRIFVLSIDQRIYWTAIIFVALVFLSRFLSKGQTTLPTEAALDSNETINTIRYWRIRFSLTDSGILHGKSLKRELVDLLASIYASKQPGSTNFGIAAALQTGQIPLPEHVHTFLFPEERQESAQSIKRLLQAIRKTPRKWIRRWTGQETAEKYRMIEEVLCFMETSLEINNEEREFTPNEH